MSSCSLNPLSSLLFHLPLSLSILEDRRHDIAGEPGAGAGDHPRVPDRARGQLPRPQQPRVVGVSDFLSYRLAHFSRMDEYNFVSSFSSFFHVSLRFELDYVVGFVFLVDIAVLVSLFYDFA